MKKNVREFAEQAGFVFWSNESWKPKDATIDWSSDYDQELDTFYRLVVNKCISLVEGYVDERMPASTYGELLEGEMLSTSYVTVVEEDTEGNHFIQLPEEAIKQLGWGPDTEIKWVDNGDGSYTLVRADEDQDSL